MKALFVKSNTPGSWLIRKVTGTDCSHCALEVYPDIVIHSSIGGVQFTTKKNLLSSHTLVHEVEINANHDLVEDKIDNLLGKGYDYLALAFLGIIFLGSKLGFKMPSKNEWNLSGCFICTELLSDLVEDKIDSMTTPHDLYLTLSSLSTKDQQ